MDMLPTKRTALPPTLPLSREQSLEDVPQPAVNQSAFIVVEARNPRAPELDGEAPEPHILEIETVEQILEMYGQHPVGELEGQNEYAAAL